MYCLDDIIILHPELVHRNAGEEIVSQLNRAEEIKEKMSDLSSERFKLEKVLNTLEKELNALKGTMFDIKAKEFKKKEFKPNKINLMFKGLDNTKY